MKIIYENNMEDINKWENFQFYASHSSMKRLMKSRKIKFRKRKCGKEKTVMEGITEFKDFLDNLH